MYRTKVLARPTAGLSSGRTAADAVRKASDEQLDVIILETLEKGHGRSKAIADELNLQQYLSTLQKKKGQTLGEEKGPAVASREKGKVSGIESSREESKTSSLRKSSSH